MEIFSLRSPFLIVLLIITTVTTAAAEVNLQELDAAFFSLRIRGYTLFPNAIATSDVLLRLLSAGASTSANCSFTLFSPTDSHLFSLDFSSSASLYTRTLLLHVSPCRLSASDLCSLSRPQIDSLLPNHGLKIGTLLASKNGCIPGSLTVNGVHVSKPDIFLGSDIVVHGLDGLLAVVGSRFRVNDDSSGELVQVSPSSWCGMCASSTKSPETSPTAGSRRPKPTPDTTRHHYLRSGSGELEPVSPSTWSEMCASPTKSLESSTPAESRRPNSTPDTIDHHYQKIGAGEPDAISPSSSCEMCASPVKSPESSPPEGSRRPKSTTPPDTTDDYYQGSNRKKLHDDDYGNYGNTHLHDSFFKYNPHFPL
ncbi:hypothetical protein SLEP1_g8552 [Rubroshorea leprosula]|uniref:FAS1 domain-containing protein n=1 Tax=Rubroshorea leprosula TaxID=152421 RepID=A0AAV5I6K7_9ROSI|nr:hypothetical protein SLEP1_g8552 [Rubroshorea leprosula]